MGQLETQGKGRSGLRVDTMSVLNEVPNDALMGPYRPLRENDQVPEDFRPLLETGQDGVTYVPIKVWGQ